jgi:hypothetical protein
MVINETDLKFSQFNEDQLKLLRMFHEKMEEINNCRIIKNDALRGSVHHRYDKNGSKVEVNFPDADDLRSLLLLMSTIVRTREKINYEIILSILIDKSVNIDTQSYFKLLQKYYKEALNSGLRYGANGREYSEEDIFRLRVNGCYFHLDEEKLSKLESLKGIPYAADGAVLGTLCVHVSFLKLINKIITDRILSLND